jgi:hypothetical protein
MFHRNILLSGLKMEEVCSSAMLVSTYKTTWCYNPEDQYRYPLLDPPHFRPKDGGSMFLQDTGMQPKDHVVQQPRRQSSREHIIVLNATELLHRVRYCRPMRYISEYNLSAQTAHKHFNSCLSNLNINVRW